MHTYCEYRTKLNVYFSFDSILLNSTNPVCHIYHSLIRIYFDRAILTNIFSAECCLLKSNCFSIEASLWFQMFASTFVHSYIFAHFSVRMSVHRKRFGGNVFLSSFQDKCLKGFVKILPINVHLCFNLFVRLSVINSLAAYGRTRPYLCI